MTGYSADNGARRSPPFFSLAMFFVTIFFVILEILKVDQRCKKHPGHDFFRNLAQEFFRNLPHDGDASWPSRVVTLLCLITYAVDWG